MRQASWIGSCGRWMVAQSGPAALLQGAEKGGAEEPEDHGLGRSRGGYGSKIHVAADSRGTPLGVVVTPGQRHESIFIGELLDVVRIKRCGRGRPRKRPRKVCGDKGYSTPQARRALRRRRIKPIIPRRKDEIKRGEGGRDHFEQRAYRQRNTIERLIGWLKECRRLATRYEKLARNFLAMLLVGFAVRYLRRFRF